MTNPYARPDEPGGQQPWAAPQEETTPLPDAGYPTQPNPWSQGFEQTAVDPLASNSGYTNPAVDEQPEPQPQFSPQAQPTQQPAAYPPPAATFEQPPMPTGYFPYEPTRQSGAVAVPSYPLGYPMTNLPDHPNAVPALVLAILGFFVGLTFPIAWYLGAKGNADIKRQPGRWRPNAMLTVGMVIGIVGTALMVLGFGLVAFFIIALTVAA